MKSLLPLFCLGAALAQAPSPPGALYLPAAKLKGYAASLKAKIAAASGKAMSANEPLGNRGNYTFQIIRRDESGEPEIHEAWNDIHIVQEGEGGVIYGGKIEGGRQTAPGEIRGGKIVGGTTQKLGPGDVVDIPAGVPHQTTVEKGKSYTVLIFKVEKK